ncbi:SurA N-terminal domain-containing protein [Haloechinothrix sp. YIM 98757]|uniref:SurA N-terminal domain-containing protein n=1 Tax=Haloechinothrix aidingensis TaxID=2752311 RepID=A0A838A2K9_9PSEU|nr:SurA N-terminal domain-containing protein [Haloechinothrix aidingensis]
MGWIIRRFAPIIVLVSSVLLLAGCGNGPTKASSAAIVGDETISLEQVQQDVNWLLHNMPEARQAEEQDGLGQFSRHVLRAHIHHELLDVAAEREGLSAEREDVDEILESWGGVDEAPAAVGIPPEYIERFATDIVLLQELGERYIDRVSVDIVGAEVTGDTPEEPMREQAMALGREIADDPGRANEIIEAEGQPVIDETFSPGDLIEQGAMELATSALFSAESGTVAVIQPNSQQPVWLVALVTGRDVGGGEGDADGAQTPQADPQMLYSLGLRMLSPIAEELGVEVNPRYGVWDPAGVDIAESEDHTVGELIPARDVEP